VASHLPLHRAESLPNKELALDNGFVQPDLVTTLSAYIYRIANYAMFNLIDDPAILAMAFC
jgi:hypothetical protein